MTTKEITDRIFKEPGISYELTEFEALGKPIHEILEIYPKTSTSGRDAGKTKYFLKSLIPFSSGNEEVQVYVEGGKSAPEEIVRQLWVYKLTHHYGYHADEIDLEKSVQFGTEVGTKAAITRSKRLLYLTWPQSKFMPWDRENRASQHKSRFLAQIEGALPILSKSADALVVAEDPARYPRK